ncbi:proline rich membrane protein [Mycobacterium tuberculosis]|nr:proline rich membrane protein [Mycobacterium tuberculosis]
MTTTSRRPPVRAPKKKRTAAAAGTEPAGGTATAVKPAPKAPPKSPAKAPAASPAKAPGKAAPKSAAAGKGAKARSARPAAARPRPAAAYRAAPRAPFVLLIIGLLGGALVSLLLLNTVLAKDAFTLTRLQQSNKQLQQQRQALEEENAREGSPAGLSRKAKALGMKEAEDPAFFDTGTGRASGGRIRPVPHAAAASAGAAGVVGVPGTVVPGDGVRPAAGSRAGAGARPGSGTP